MSTPTERGSPTDNISGTASGGTNATDDDGGTADASHIGTGFGSGASNAETYSATSLTDSTIVDTHHQPDTGDDESVNSFEETQATGAASCDVDLNSSCASDVTENMYVLLGYGHAREDAADIPNVDDSDSQPKKPSRRFTRGELKDCLEIPTMESEDIIQRDEIVKANQLTVDSAPNTVFYEGDHALFHYRGDWYDGNISRIRSDSAGVLRYYSSSETFTELKLTGYLRHDVLPYMDDPAPIRELSHRNPCFATTHTASKCTFGQKIKLLNDTEVTILRNDTFVRKLHVYDPVTGEEFSVGYMKVKSFEDRSSRALYKHVTSISGLTAAEARRQAEEHSHLLAQTTSSVKQRKRPLHRFVTPPNNSSDDRDENDVPLSGFPSQTAPKTAKRPHKKRPTKRNIMKPVAVKKRPSSDDEPDNQPTDYDSKTTSTPQTPPLTARHLREMEHNIIDKMAFQFWRPQYDLLTDIRSQLARYTKADYPSPAQPARVVLGTPSYVVAPNCPQYVQSVQAEVPVAHHNEQYTTQHHYQTSSQQPQDANDIAINDFLTGGDVRAVASYFNSGKSSYRNTITVPASYADRDRVIHISTPSPTSSARSASSMSTSHPYGYQPQPLIKHSNVVDDTSSGDDTILGTDSPKRRIQDTENRSPAKRQRVSASNDYSPTSPHRVSRRLRLDQDHDTPPTTPDFRAPKSFTTTGPKVLANSSDGGNASAVPPATPPAPSPMAPPKLSKSAIAFFTAPHNATPKFLSVDRVLESLPKGCGEGLSLSLLRAEIRACPAILIYTPRKDVVYIRCAGQTAIALYDEANLPFDDTHAESEARLHVSCLRGGTHATKFKQFFNSYMDHVEGRIAQNFIFALPAATIATTKNKNDKSLIPSLYPRPYSNALSHAVHHVTNASDTFEDVRAWSATCTKNAQGRNRDRLKAIHNKEPEPLPKNLPCEGVGDGVGLTRQKSTGSKQKQADVNQPRTISLG